MDKWIECNPNSHLEVDKWQEREDYSLDPMLDQPVGRGRANREERGKKILERESLPSL